MRIGIFGAGGVGGYFGARLADAGHDVVFIARGEHLAAMRRDGLRVNSPLGDTTVSEVTAMQDIADAGPLDLVLITVKLWSTEDVAQALKPLAEAGTSVVSFQNGVTQYEVLRATLPAGSLLGGVTFISAHIESPGVIVHNNELQALHFGEFDGTRSERVAAFARACEDAGIDAQVSDHIERLIWQKFVFLVGLSATTAAMRQPIGAIRDNEQARAFLFDVMNEVVSVGRARGVDLAPDFADDRLAFCDTLPAGMTASLYHDLKQGNRMELPWLSGAVVDYGLEKGVPTPCNRAVSAILALYTEGAVDPK